MLSLRFGVAVALLAASASLLGAGDKTLDPNAPLPWNPFATARKGDWVTVGQKAPVAAQNGDVPWAYITWTIADVRSDSVVLESTRNDAPGARQDSFSAKKPPTFFEVLQVIGTDPSAKVTRLAVEDVKVKLGGKTIAAKRYTFVLAEHAQKADGTDVGEIKTDEVLILSPAVKSLGIVSSENRRPGSAPGSTAMNSLDIVGHGSAAKTEWGQTAAEAASKTRAK